MLAMWTKGPCEDSKGVEDSDHPPTTAPCLPCPSHCPHLLAQGHSAAQGTRQPDHLGHEGLEGEVLLQHDAPQDGLHLGDPRAWHRGDSLDPQPWHKDTGEPLPIVLRGSLVLCHPSLP